MNLDVLEYVETNGSRLEKERYLAQLEPSSLKFLKWALDPMVTFGVTVDEDEQLASWDKFTFRMGSSDEWWQMFDGLCSDLHMRKLTGNAALNAVDDVMKPAPERRMVVWAGRVLNKDLRSGFGVSTLNKVFPGTLQPFACSLAEAYDPEKHELGGVWNIEPKLDGLRMVVLDGVAYTRNGRTIDSVGHILEELAPLMDDYVFDGEVMGETGFDEDSGKTRKKGKGPNLSLTYNVFDCVDRDEWISRKSTKSYTNRRSDLFSALGTAAPVYTKIVKTTPLEYNPTTEQLFRARDELMAQGYEGAMLKDSYQPYVFKRSDYILKLKDFVSIDAPAVETYVGKGRHKGRLGGIVFEHDAHGKPELGKVQTKVGSGFSDPERDAFWNDKESVPGKIGEVQFQNYTKDGRLRFPVFVKFRPDKE